MKLYYTLLIFIVLLAGICGFIIPTLLTAESDILVILGFVIMLGIVPYIIFEAYKSLIKNLKEKGGNDD